MRRYFKNIYLAIVTLVTGLKITFMHLFVKSTTMQYPHVRMEMPERSRSRLYVDIEDCIGCYLCDKACPVDCIHIETIKARPGEELGLTKRFEKKKTFVFPEFDIDMSECCYCGLCVFPCPTECIYWTDNYEFSEYDRSNFLYHFGNVTPDEAKNRYEEAERLKLEKENAIAAKKAQQEAEKAEDAAGEKPSGKAKKE